MDLHVFPWSATYATARIILLLHLSCFIVNITAQLYPFSSVPNNGNTKQLSIAASVNPETPLRFKQSELSIFEKLPKIETNDGPLQMKNQELNTKDGLRVTSNPDNKGSILIDSLSTLKTNGNTEFMEAKNQGLGASVGKGNLLGSSNLGPIITGSLPSIVANTNADLSDIKNQRLDASGSLGGSLSGTNLNTEIIGSLPSIGDIGGKLDSKNQELSTSFDIGDSMDSSEFGSTNIRLLPSIGANDSELKSKNQGLNVPVSLGATIESVNSEPTTIESLPTTESNRNTIKVNNEVFGSSIGIGSSLESIGLESKMFGISFSTVAYNKSDFSNLKNQDIDVSTDIGALLNTNYSDPITIDTQQTIGSVIGTLESNNQNAGITVSAITSTSTENFGSSSFGSPSTGNSNGSALNGYEQETRGSLFMGASTNATNYSLTTENTLTVVSLPQTESNIVTTGFNYQQKDNITKDILTSSSVNPEDIFEQSIINEWSKPIPTPSVITEKSTWVQVIPSTDMLQSRTQKAPLRVSAEQIYPGKLVWFGQIISNVLYGAPWSAYQTNSKCVNDMRVYNLHLRNNTLWAVKSKRLVLNYIFKYYNMNIFQPLSYFPIPMNNIF